MAQSITITRYNSATVSRIYVRKEIKYWLKITHVHAWIFPKNLWRYDMLLHAGLQIFVYKVDNIYT